jgi:hypothetical protein
VLDAIERVFARFRPTRAAKTRKSLESQGFIFHNGFKKPCKINDLAATASQPRDKKAAAGKISKNITQRFQPLS